MSIAPPSSRLSGKGFLIFIGISLILIGSLFVWLMARSYLRAKEIHAWPQVECTILSSEVVERQHDPYSAAEFQHQVSFAYDWNGEAMTSDRISLRGSKWSSKPGKAALSLQAYPPGGIAKCYVNPNTPSMAVLEPDSLAPGYSIWFPCLFVVGGLGIAFRAIRPVFHTHE